MKTMTDTGLRKQAQRFVDSLSHAEYELDGVTKRIDLFRTSVEGDLVKVFVFFDDAVAGEIGSVQLIDKDGDTVARAERSFIKPATKGLYVVFKYRYTEMEVEGIGL